MLYYSTLSSSRQTVALLFSYLKATTQMAIQNITRFSSFQLTPQEQTCGSILTIDQKLVIQNLISERAELKLSLEPDDPQFIKQSAYFAGQIEILEYLISVSDALSTNALDY